MLGVQVVHDLNAAAALLSSPRLRVLEELREPDSATGVSRRIGLSRQQVNYHLRELEQAGLVDFVEERRKGNCTERVVRASARRYVISPEALGSLGATPEERADRFSMSYLVGLASRLIRELGTIGRRAAETGKRVATLGLDTEIRFATPAERTAFCEELTQAVTALAEKYHAPEGRAFRLVAGAYPLLREEPHAEKIPVRN